MVTGVWEPAPSASGPTPDDALLARLVVISQAADAEAGLLQVSAQDTDELRGLMKLPAEAWHVAEGLGSDDLIRLIRFFTLAEMQLPGWDAGKTSPVIPLVKVLKARNEFSADLRRWVKANTDNRYLPNGAVL